MARKGKPPAGRHSAAKPAAAKIPAQIAPMMAQARVDPFDSDEYLFEIKWDGARCLAFVDADRIRLQSRRQIEMRARYPELECLSRLPAGTILDGEIIVLYGGKPSFARLQQREHLQDPARMEFRRRRFPATFMAFDLLYLDGASWLRNSLVERREKLRSVVEALASPHVLCADYIVGAGREYFAAAEQHGLEGIMAKRLASNYQPGKRSADWLTIRVAQTARFAIIGYTPHENSKSAIGAIIIGERNGRRWNYKGRVGSGFTEAQRAELFTLLNAKSELGQSPANGPKDAVWKATGYHCLVRFFEKTAVGMLRAPVFMGVVE